VEDDAGLSGGFPLAGPRELRAQSHKLERRKEKPMRLNAPKLITWIVAIVVAVLGVIGYILAVALPTPPGWLMHLSFWVEVLAALILIAATAMAGV
jgi:uncharacterized membrane protein HdeD (DUF308 family)